MDCCKPLIFPFSDTETISISYTDALKTTFGDTPEIEVYHKAHSFPIGTTDLPAYVKVVVQISVDGTPTTTITVNNGGKATGYIKIS